MGRETVTLTVTASVSRHNSEEDRENDAALDRLRRVIETVLEAPEYQDMGAVVFGP